MTIEEMRQIDAEKTYKELIWERSEVLRLTTANLQLREGCEELKQRIKRLEEAGDRMSHTCVTIDADRWRKAKEAKP